MQKYSTYAEVPWYRKSSTNSLFILISIFFPLLIGLVCILLITGKIYFNKLDVQGNLKTWSVANKVVAFVFLFVQLTFLAFRYLF